VPRFFALAVLLFLLVPAPARAADPRRGQQWNLDLIEADGAHAVTTGAVAGVAALLVSRGVRGQAAVRRLLATATDLGAPGNDSEYGAGLVNARRRGRPRRRGGRAVRRGFAFGDRAAGAPVRAREAAAARAAGDPRAGAVGARGARARAGLPAWATGRTRVAGGACVARLDGGGAADAARAARAAGAGRFACARAGSAAG
jgi:hypothetical protein